MLNINHDKQRTLPFSLSVHEWITNQNICADTKYRLQKLILIALAQQSRTFTLTKNDFEKLVETTNRRTQKNILYRLAQVGIITILKEDHFQLHFELSQELFSGETIMDRSPQVNLKFEDPAIYEMQFKGTSSETIMTHKKEVKIDKYNDDVSELLSEVTSKEVLERISLSPALKQAYELRIQRLRANIKAYEKRHGENLGKELANLDSIGRILNATKVFNVSNKTYEEQKDANLIRVNPKALVTYFYRQLSTKLGEPIYTSHWPSEIEAAKSVLRHMPDKSPEFIRGYIDWVLEFQTGMRTVHDIRYHVSQYIQALEDSKFWTPIWENYMLRTPNEKGVIIPKNDDELACLFVRTFEKVYGDKYKPLKTFRKDISGLKQLKLYLGDNFENAVQYITWCLESVLPAQKEKPASPGDLYRFIQDFKESKMNQIAQKTKEPVDDRMLAKIQRIIKDAAKRNTNFSMSEVEMRVVQKLFEHVKFDQLDEESKNIVKRNSEIFRLTEAGVTIGGEK